MNSPTPNRPASAFMTGIKRTPTPAQAADRAASVQQHSGNILANRLYATVLNSPKMPTVKNTVHRPSSATTTRSRPDEPETTQQMQQQKATEEKAKNVLKVNFKSFSSRTVTRDTLFHPKREFEGAGLRHQEAALSHPIHISRSEYLQQVRNRLHHLESESGTILPVDNVDDPLSPFYYIARVFGGTNVDSSSEEISENDGLDKLSIGIPGKRRNFIYVTLREHHLSARYYDPYFLQVSKTSAETDETMTLSDNGMVKFSMQQNPDDGHITPLEDWMTEYFRFRKLLGISFFTESRKRKLFDAWLKHVRQTKMHQAAEELKKNLFQANPLLQNALLEVRKLCIEAEDCAGKLLIHKHVENVHSIEKYCEIQADHQRLGAERLSRQRSRIISVIEAAVTDVERQRVQHEKELQAVSLIPSEKAERSFTELARKRHCCKQILRFIRLCDHMHVRSLVRLAINSLQALFHDVVSFERVPPKNVNTTLGAVLAKQKSIRIPQPPSKAPSKSSKQLLAGSVEKKKGKEEVVEEMLQIYLELILHPVENVMYVPRREEVERKVENSMEDMLNVVYNVEPFVVSDTFKNFVSVALFEQEGSLLEIVGGNLQGGPRKGMANVAQNAMAALIEMVSMQEEFKELTVGIRRVFSRSFDHVDQFRLLFYSFAESYKECELVNAESIRDRDPNADWYREQLDHFRTEITKIDGLFLVHDVKLFEVHLEKLQATLHPAPRRCVQLICQLLPTVALDKNNRLVNDLSEVVVKLRKAPENVRAFSAYVDHYNHTAGRIKEIEREVDAVRELYLLMDIESEIEVPADDQLLLHQGTIQQWVALQELMTNFEEHKEAHIQRFGLEIFTILTEISSKSEDIDARASEACLDDDATPCEDAIKMLEQLSAETEELEALDDEYTSYQTQFGIDVTHVDTLNKTSRLVREKLKLWIGVRDWQVLIEELMQTVIKQLDVEAVQSSVDKFTKLLYTCARTISNENTVLMHLKEEVDDIRAYYPVMESIRNPHLKHVHWRRIDELARAKMVQGREHNISDDDTVTFGYLHNELHIVDLVEELQAISVVATQEYLLDRELQDIQRIWQGGSSTAPVEFQVAPYKNQKDMFVIGANIEDITAIIEETSIRASSLSTNRFSEGILKVRGQKLEEEINLISRTIDAWIEFQRTWMYLEGIFGQPEIAFQWPTDEKIFRKIDKQFREVMRKVVASPNVYYACGTSRSLLEQFEKHIPSLEKILQSLERKLEVKRRIFPRFYFLSNDDLLDVLAQVKTPDRVQPHLLKMFDNIKRFKLASSDIQEIYSSEGEVIPISRGVRAKGEVERWLCLLEEKVTETLKQKSQECIKNYTHSGKMDWIYQYPVQLILCVNQIVWVQNITKALEPAEDGMSLNVQELLKEEEERCKRGLRRLAAETMKDLSPIHRALISTLITLEVHMRDITQELILEKVESTHSFEWGKQLRAYWNPEQQCIYYEQNGFKLPYGYEYLGAQGRLVITPVTDRIYMTITGALHHELGAAPAGPAGTGKTETVKDLAKNVARQCIVFNCSDGVTYKMMERLYSGLIQCGCWCCLDEFNRINIEVLSVIAAQLMEIQTALRNKQELFSFQGSEMMRLVPTYGVFITMNPGYAGRTELPDNLKSLFRPVAVMIPDYCMIAEVILFSEGFTNAQSLSRKITQLYKLSSEQLSSQDHYDFGMRALKSILQMAGFLKRSQQDRDEDLTLIQACFDSNLPKLVTADIPLFRGIMWDLFPGVALPEIENPLLQTALESVMHEEALCSFDPQLRKALQFYATLNVRFGVMLVGESGCGKTVIRNAVAKSLTRLEVQGKNMALAKSTVEHVLNPKSVSYSELFGSMNPLTQEWTDGVLIGIVKELVHTIQQLQAANLEAKDDDWIVFDGPVDTYWIESMNSVLDDSRLLCLDNGVRIKLPTTFRMIFEVEDLASASPATVSRCGMVYLNRAELSIHCFMKSQLKRLFSDALDQDQMEQLSLLCETYLPKGTEFVASQLSSLIPTLPIQLVQSVLSLLRLLLKGRWTIVGKAPDQWREALNNLFGYSYVWGIGGNTFASGGENFDNFCRSELESVANFPGYGLVYDFYVNESNFRFARWQDVVPEFHFDLQTPYFDLIVPTKETHRMQDLIGKFLAEGQPVLLSGESGIGKTVMVDAAMSELRQKGVISAVTIQFSAQTSSVRTQASIEAKMTTKRRKNLLGSPHPGQQICFFVDDINMPVVESFGACPPLELLRQLITSGGFFDRTKLFFKTVKDTVLVAACGTPEGGRSVMTKRLTRLFFPLQAWNLSEESTKKLFGSIVNSFLDSTFEGTNTRGDTSLKFSSDVKALGRSMVGAAAELFLGVQAELRPVPSKPHYTFNLRDLSKVFQGILQVTPKTCSNSKVAAALWAHEVQRCFGDRLTTSHDRERFLELTFEAMRRVGLTAGFQGHSAEEFFSKEIVWGDFVKVGATPVYEAIPDPSILPRVFEEYQGTCSATHDFNMVFFKGCCQHLCRIIRILRQPRGNALLIGVSGCGKRSVAKLGAAVVGHRLFTIEVGRGYNMNSFRENLVELCTSAGVDGKSIVFLLTDSQIVDEGMLEDACNLLNTGDVPNLFAAEEKDKLVNSLLELAKTRNIEGRHEVYDMFISMVRENLHIVFCMSPVGDDFRLRCRKFPSLTNCCNIDWYEVWPTEALLSVAERQLSERMILSHQDVSKAAKLAASMHQGVAKVAERFEKEQSRKYYVTPATFLEFLQLYQNSLSERKKKFESAKKRMDNGLAQMKAANETVNTMEAKIKEMEPELQKKKDNVEVLQEDLTVRAQRAKEVAKDVEGQRTIAQDEEKRATALKLDAQKDLDEAMPEVDAAMSALKSLQKADIDEIKKYSVPTRAVSTTIEAVLTLLKEKKPGDWATAKIVLGNPRFIDRLFSLSVNELDDITIGKMQKFVRDPDYTPTKVGTAGSEACRSLCMWTTAMEHYYHVNLRVEPKRNALGIAEANAKKAKDSLAEAEERSAQANAQMKDLQDTLTKATKELDKLEEKLQQSRKRLAAAGILTVSLKGESQRWAFSVAELEETLKSLPGAVLLASAAVAYLGAFSTSYRQQLEEQWWLLVVQGEDGLPLPDEYSFVSTLGEPILLRDWAVFGLPSDPISTQNALITTQTCGSSSFRWPLLIDPQAQAQRWIRNMEGTKNLKQLHIRDPKLMLHLRQCISHGHPVIVDGIEDSIDNSLDSLLLRQVATVQGRLLLKVGGDDLDYSPDFRLYLRSSEANPKLHPELCLKTRLVNFTVTSDALEEQVLGDIVSVEKRELEEQKQTNIKIIADSKKKLHDEEEKILELLADSKGNILDNQQLIDTLKSSQTLSDSLKIKVEETERQTVQLLEQRNVFQQVAKRITVLFLTTSDIGKCQDMYQYGLGYIKSLYFDVLKTATPSHLHSAANPVEARNRYLIEAVTSKVVLNVSRGLFYSEKTLFVLLVACNILRRQDKISDLEWQTFIDTEAISSSVKVTRFSKPEDPAISEASWKALDKLGTIVPNLATLTEDITLNFPVWQEWLQDSQVHKTKCPLMRVANVEPPTSFQELLILKLLNPAKAVLASQTFISKALGEQYIELISKPTDLEALVNDTSPSVPILFLLSKGSDPIEQFLKCARSCNVDDVPMVSLGQGQEQKAMSYIQQGIKKGGWVMLQNCHLSQTVMPELDKQVIQLVTGTTEVRGGVNPNFRLWMTSMPCDFFPSTILQNSLKIASEPPKGIRSHLLHAFNSISDELLNPVQEDIMLSCGLKKSIVYRNIVYGICFFHAALLERKKFGAVGWNNTYDFNDSDLEVSLKNVHRMVVQSANQQLPWKALHYVVGEINYGGRVTDSWDRSTLKATLEQFLSPKILEAEGKFFSTSSHYVTPVNLITATAYKEFVESTIPAEDEADIFGMHEVSNLRSQLVASTAFLGMLVEIGATHIKAPKDEEGDQEEEESLFNGSRENEEADNPVERARHLLRDLPPFLDETECGPKTLHNLEGSELLHPLATLLLHEMQRYNTLILLMSNTLRDFLKAMKGQTVFSDTLDDVHRCFVTNRVPKCWHTASFTSNKPLASWYNDLLQRVHFIRQWLKYSAPTCYWLGAFFYPHGFLTALLQAFARSAKYSIDIVSFSFEVLEGTDPVLVTTAPNTGAYVYGLYCDAFRYAAGMRDQLGLSYTAMPMLHFKPTPNHSIPLEHHMVPLYKTTARAGVLSSLGASTNFIVGVELPTSKGSAYWIKLGAALVTMLPE